MHDFIDECVTNSRYEKSKLTDEILKLEGMSSNKVRHLLNNLCSAEGTRYLEVGCWKGSTLVSALYGNNVDKAVAIDNFSEFGGPKEELHQNIQNHIKDANLTFIEGSFENIKLPVSDFNIYFYDGEHSAKSQEDALTLLYPYLADQFIYIVDDWNHGPAREGTEAGLARYKVLKKVELPANYNGDRDNYWNGIGLFLLQK